MTILDLVHHFEWSDSISDWTKYRRTYNGGEVFKTQYLKRLSKDEEDLDYNIRKEITYVPRFAGTVVDEIKNSIYQRLVDVRRVGGPESYQKAIMGENEGVDLQKSTMDFFIGDEVLIELLIMKKVGVLTDNFIDLGTTVQDKGNKHPFYTTYVAENILSWTKDSLGFKTLLLQEFIETKNSLGLSSGREARFRLYERLDGEVKVTFFKEDETPVFEIILKKKSIPFTIFEIKNSLLKDVCDYQIALMNLESTDIQFGMKANYSLYYEFADSHTDPFYTETENEEDRENYEAKKRVKAGINIGRKFDKGLDPPGYINPNPETLIANMAKEEQIKNDIRVLVGLNLQNLNPRRQSVESKKVDMQPLQSAHSYIGLVMRNGEGEMAQHWAEFEGSKTPAKITYPNNWDIRSREDRLKEAEDLALLLPKVPSPTYKKKIFKKIVSVTVGNESTEEELDKINKEIDTADVLVTDPQVLLKANDQVIISNEDVAKALNFPKGTTKKAEEERAETLKLTIMAQGEMNAARGVPEAAGSKTSSEEKDNG